MSLASKWMLLVIVISVLIDIYLWKKDEIGTIIAVNVIAAIINWTLLFTIGSYGSHYKENAVDTIHVYITLKK